MATQTGHFGKEQQMKNLKLLGSYSDVWGSI
jgi:hypothetical protein